MEKIGQCPFHTGLAHGLPDAPMGGPGLDYSKLLLQASGEGWPAVMHRLNPTERRALASAPLCEIFWQKFSEIQDQLNWQLFIQIVKEGEEHYILFLRSVFDLIEKALSAVQDSDLASEARNRLEDCLRGSNTKGRYLHFTKQHLYTELRGGLTVIARFCELVEVLYQQKNNSSIPLDLFEKTLLSKEFISIFVVFGLYSENNANLMMDGITDSYNNDPFSSCSPSKFDLMLSEKGYLILMVEGDFAHRLRKNYDRLFNLQGDIKVRCPALDLKVEKLEEEGQTMMLREMVVWFLRQLVKMKRASQDSREF